MERTEEEQMKIGYISPGILPEAELMRRREILGTWANKETEVELHCVSSGPRSIESAYEEYLSVIPSCRTVAELEEKGFDAAILGCACDPGLPALREISRKMLVMGAGTGSYLTAAMLGNRFGVLTIDRSMVQTCYDLAHRAGCAAKLAAVKPIEIPVLSLSQDYDKTMETLAAVGKRMVREKQVDTIVLGCMSMGFLGVAEELSAVLGIPCINPCKAAIKMTEAMVGMGLTHSKEAYPIPSKMRNDSQMTIEDLCLYRKEEV